MEEYLNAIANIDIVVVGSGIQLTFYQANLDLDQHQMLSSIVNIILINYIKVYSVKKASKAIDTIVVCLKDED